MEIDTLTVVGIGTSIPDIPVTFISSQSTHIVLRHKQHVSILTLSFGICLNNQNADG